MNENIANDQKLETTMEESFMKNFMKKRLNQKGLTLIELLAVIVILAIVAAIAIPAIGGLINSSEIKAVKSDAIMILNAANLEKSSGGSDFATASTVSGEYLENIGDHFTTTNYTVLEVGNKLTLTTSADIEAGGKEISFVNASIDEIDSSNAEGNDAIGPDDDGNAETGEAVTVAEPTT